MKIEKFRDVCMTGGMHYTIAIQGFTGVYMGVHSNTGVYRSNIDIYGMSYKPGDYMVRDYM